MKSKFLKSLTSLMLICVVGFFSTQMHAQPPNKFGGDSAEKMQHHLKKMTTELELSEIQVAAVKTVLEKYAPQLQSIRSAEGDRTAKFEKMKAIKAQIEVEITPILSPEQQAKHQTMMQERRGGEGRRHGRIGGQGKGHGHGERFNAEEMANRHTERMTKELNLTEEQSARVLALNQSFAAKKKEAMKEKMAERKGTSEGKRRGHKPHLGDFDQEEMKAKRAAMEVEYNQAIQPILTVQQYQQLLAHQQERKNKMEAHKVQIKELHSNEELRNAIKSYVGENVLPKVKTQRAKLDQHISAADQATLERLRNQMRANKEEIKAAKKAIKAAKMSGTTIPQDAVDFLKEIFEQSEPQRVEAKALADKYDTQIQALCKEMKPDAEQWRTDIRTIVKPYLPQEMRDKHDTLQKFREENGKEQGGMHKHGKGMHKQGKGKRGHHQMDFAKHLKRMTSPVGFLLLDPNASANVWDEVTEEAGNNAPFQREVNIYPNPASNNNTIVFEVKTASVVKVDLVNKDGILIRTLLNEFKEVGTHKMNINLDDLRPDMYYYFITDADGQSTSNFIVSK